MDPHPKSQLRQQFFDEYRDLDLDGRRLWLLHAVDEVERLAATGAPYVR
jgi:hypothetical protein